MTDRPSILLMVGWIVTLALGIATSTIVTAGVRRDNRAGEATIAISLGERSEWRIASFWVWNSAPYALRVSTVNFDRPRVGAMFRGALHVVIRRPDGATLVDQQFDPGTMDHTMPYNYGDTTLITVPLDPAWIRPWRLEVRVTEPDPQFANVRSEVKLWRDRVDPGMGGLITYVLIVPAIMLLLLAVFLSLVLLRRGRRMPLTVSVIVVVVFFVAWLS